jgi:hypothetical protein
MGKTGLDNFQVYPFSIFGSAGSEKGTHGIGYSAPLPNDSTHVIWINTEFEDNHGGTLYFLDADPFRIVDNSTCHMES